MMSRLPGEILKEVFFCFFSSHGIVQTCNPDISKIIIAMSFQFGQLIQDGEIILIDKLLVVSTVFQRHISSFSCFCCHLVTFFKIYFSKNSFMNT